MKQEKIIIIAEHKGYRQERINVSEWKYVSEKKRVPADIYNEKELSERGVFAITRESAELLREFFRRKLDNDFAGNYETFSPDLHWSVKDFSVLLRIKNNYDPTKEPLLIVEPLSGGMTLAQGQGMYGRWSYRNVYVALILTNNRVEPKYRHTVIIAEGQSKWTTYTSAKHNISGEYERLFRLYNSSATGRHSTTYYIGILRERQKIEIAQWRDTSCDNQHLDICEYNADKTEGNCKNIY